MGLHRVSYKTSQGKTPELEEEAKQKFIEVVKAARLEDEWDCGYVINDEGIRIGPLDGVKIGTCRGNLARCGYTAWDDPKLSIQWDYWTSRTEEYKLRLLLHEVTHLKDCNGHDADYFWRHFSANVKNAYKNRHLLESFGDIDWVEFLEEMEKEFRKNNVKYHKVDKAREVMEPTLQLIEQSEGV